jgi:F-type H+-transporting ATPase subunit delta
VKRRRKRAALPGQTPKHVTNRTAATRYARALLDVAIQEKADPAHIDAQLAEFNQLVQQNDALSKVLLNPAVPAPRKGAAIAELAKRTGLQPILGKLLIMLAERDRLILLPDLVVAYRERLQDYQNIVRADVTTAAPLTAERARQIERGLTQATGRTVKLSTHIDPAIIGGVVARVGSVVYDGSVTNHLERMKQRLEEGV